MRGPKIGIELMQLDDTDLKASRPRLEDWLLVRFEALPRVVPLPPRAADPLADAIDDIVPAESQAAGWDGRCWCQGGAHPEGGRCCLTGFDLPAVSKAEYAASAQATAARCSCGERPSDFDPACEAHGCPECAGRGPGPGLWCGRCGADGCPGNADCPADGAECRQAGCAYLRWAEAPPVSDTLDLDGDTLDEPADWLDRWDGEGEP